MGLKRLIVKDFLSARRTYLNCSRINQQQQYQKPETSRYVAPPQDLVLALKSRGISMGSCLQSVRIPDDHFDRLALASNICFIGLFCCFFLRFFQSFYLLSFCVSTDWYITHPPLSLVAAAG